MKKSLRIYVSQADIDGGCQLEMFGCPIHRAIARRGILKGKTFGVGANGVIVGPNRKIVESMDMLGKVSISFTEKATNFIYDFDAGKTVKPQHVTLIDESGKYL